jgi:hypothetical protein
MVIILFLYERLHCGELLAALKPSHNGWNSNGIWFTFTEIDMNLFFQKMSSHWSCTERPKTEHSQKNKYDLLIEYFWIVDVHTNDEGISFSEILCWSASVNCKCMEINIQNFVLIHGIWWGLLKHLKFWIPN